MLKWIVLIALATILLGLFAPQLSKYGLWRLPGDLRFRHNNRDYFLPITSTVLISVLLTLLSRLIKI